jgi:hypothetical protein
MADRMTINDTLAERGGWQPMTIDPPKDAPFLTAIPHNGRWIYDIAEWDEEYQAYFNHGCGMDLVTRWHAFTPLPIAAPDERAGTGEQG